MKRSKGFTLVELLAVIVILAIILVIAVPQITKVIKQTRVNAMQSTAKLIVTKAEEKEVENEALEITETMTCSDLVKLDDNYNASGCTIEKNAQDKWEVSISGASGKKFEGITCTGTKDNMTCGDGSSNTPVTPEYVYAFGEITSANDPNAKANWNELKDSGNQQRPVFLKFKNDLSEIYTCTLYDSSIPNGLGSTPTCISANAYNNRTETNSEWSAMQALFDNCSEYSGDVNCYAGGENCEWSCDSHAIGATCAWGDFTSDTFNVVCDVNVDGSFGCHD